MCISMQPNLQCRYFVSSKNIWIPKFNYKSTTFRKDVGLAWFHESVWIHYIRKFDAFLPEIVILFFLLHPCLTFGIDFLLQKRGRFLSPNYVGYENTWDGRIEINKVFKITSDFNFFHSILIWIHGYFVQKSCYKDEIFYILCSLHIKGFHGLEFGRKPGD